MLFFLLNFMKYTYVKIANLRANFSPEFHHIWNLTSGKIHTLPLNILSDWFWRICVFPWLGLQGKNAHVTPRLAFRSVLSFTIASRLGNSKDARLFFSEQFTFFVIWKITLKSKRKQIGKWLMCDASYQHHKHGIAHHNAIVDKHEIAHHNASVHKVGRGHSSQHQCCDYQFCWRG